MPFGAYNNNYPAPQHEHFEGGESVFISFKPSFVLGQLSPQNKTIAYGYAGAGINYIHHNGMHHPYNENNENYSDTMKHESERNEFSGILGIGGGLGFRISPKFSIIGEAEFNILTIHNFESYIPVRVGVSYFIY
jgi:hypothetical protein